jgi:hypothetical protein
MGILVLLVVMGFIVGFTYEKKWSCLAGFQGALICALYGVLTYGIVQLFP